MPGRQLGTALPPPLRACMARIAALTTDEAIDAYGLPSRQNALALRTRARDMLTKGFEWTLQHGLPLNRGMYASADPQPPCCAVVPHPDMFGLNGGGGGGSGTFIGKCADGDCFVPHFRPPPNATAGDLSEYRLEDFPALQL